MSARRTSKYFGESESSLLSAQQSSQAQLSISQEISTKEASPNGKTETLSSNHNNDNNNNITSSLIIHSKNVSVKKALSENDDELSLIRNKKLKKYESPELISLSKLDSTPQTITVLSKTTKSNAITGPLSDDLTAINAIADATLLCYEKPRMLTRLAKKLMEQANTAEVTGNSKAQSRNISVSPITTGRTLLGVRSSTSHRATQTNTPIATPIANGVMAQRSIARKSLPREPLPSGTLLATYQNAARQTKPKPRSTTPRSRGRPKKEIVFPETSSSPSASSSNGISLSSLGSGGTSAMPAEFSTPEYVRERLEMVPFQAPKDWQKVLANTKQMRFNAGNAPVDDFGPMRWMLQSVNSDELDNLQLNLCRFRVIVCLILSIRGRDKIVNSVMEALGGETITPQSILAMSHSELVDKIRSVGLQETKANYLRQTSKLIIEKYNMVIPNNMEDLYQLPGIDNKCGVLALHIGFNKDCGIAVDTHVHRIANRLGWANSNNPSKTMMQLQDWVPRDEWGKLNHLLVGFGQLICTPKNPSCQSCLNSTICPYGKERLRNLDF